MCQGDPNIALSRKYAVLQTILNQNELTGIDVELKKNLKSILTKDGSFSDKIPLLERLGFTVKTDAGKHYKIFFNGDERYCGTLSMTPSDYRGTENFISVFSNLLFGY